MAERKVDHDTVRHFVLNNASSYGTGMVPKLYTIPEIADHFNVVKTTVFNIIAGTEISQARREALKERYKLPLEPSEDMAWLIGYVLPTNINRGKMLQITENVPEIREKFATTVKKLLDVDITHTQGPHDCRVDHYVRLSNKEFVQRVGPCGRAEWPSTIEQKHAWIKSDPKYTWKLLEGIFDARNTVGRHNYNNIIFPTTYRSVADYIILLLDSLEIPAEYEKAAQQSEGILGVRINDYQAIEKFADNVKPADPEAQTRIKIILERISQLRPTPEELILEFSKVANTLGFAPHTSQLWELKSEGKIEWSPYQYLKAFGSLSYQQTTDLLSKYFELEKSYSAQDPTTETTAERKIFLYNLLVHPNVKDKPANFLKALSRQVRSMQAAIQLANSLANNGKNYADKGFDPKDIEVAVASLSGCVEAIICSQSVADIQISARALRNQIKRVVTFFEKEMLAAQVETLSSETEKTLAELKTPPLANTDNADLTRTAQQKLDNTLMVLGSKLFSHPNIARIIKIILLERNIDGWEQASDEPLETETQMVNMLDSYLQILKQTDLNPEIMTESAQNLLEEITRDLGQKRFNHPDVVRLVKHYIQSKVPVATH